jgi:hypothetical protein
VRYSAKLKKRIKKKIFFGGLIPSSHDIDEKVKVNLDERLNFDFEIFITY